MKILVTGVHGQVGHALLKTLEGDYEIVALDRTQLDLSDTDAIRRVVQSVRPTLIINPAAYTAVDKAESEPALAHSINTVAPGVMAEEAAKLNASLIHFSTDYVFDGNKETPYVETDAVNPLSVYGRTKLAGELAIQSVGLPHLILRTSWVYGPHGKNFLKTMLRLSAERDQLKVVADQWGAPTSSNAIAYAVNQLLNVWKMNTASQSGVYHFTNSGSTTWHGFTCSIIDAYEVQAARLGLPPLKVKANSVGAITTVDYPTPAVRPHNSRLDQAKLNQTFGVALPAWEQSLQAVMQQIQDFD